MREPPAAGKWGLLSSIYGMRSGPHLLMTLYTGHVVMSWSCVTQSHLTGSHMKTLIKHWYYVLGLSKPQT
jgi:hypothetical protein